MDIRDIEGAHQELQYLLEYFGDSYDGFVTKLQNSLVLSLKKEIKVASEENLVEILNKLISSNRVTDLSEILILLAGSIKKLPSEFIDFVSKNKSIMELFDISLKQRVWSCNPKLHDETIIPHIIECVKSYSIRLCTLNQPEDTVDKVLVNSVTETIGRSSELYKQTLHLLLAMFLKDKNPSLCLLQFNIFMSFYEKEYTTSRLLTNNECDVCYLLYQIFKDAISKDHISAKNASLLERILIKDLNNQMEGQDSDLFLTLKSFSMMMYHPMIICLLSKTVLKLLSKLVDKKTLPRDDQSLTPFFNLMSLIDSIASGQFFESGHELNTLESQFFTNFLPGICGMLISNELNSASNVDNNCNKHQLLDNIFSQSLTFLNQDYFRFKLHHRIFAFTFCQIVLKRDWVTVRHLMSLMKNNGSQIIFPQLALKILLQHLIEFMKTEDSNTICLKDIHSLIIANSLNFYLIYDQSFKHECVACCHLAKQFMDSVRANLSPALYMSMQNQIAKHLLYAKNHQKNFLD